MCTNETHLGIWYFAYGSNLSTSQIRERLRYAPESRRAILQGYRIAFNKLGSNRSPVFANVIREEGSEVWGVIYSFRSEDWGRMDQCEGVPTHYQRVKVRALTDSGESVEAETYVAAEAQLCPEQVPSQQYALTILTGAEEHDLPGEWVSHLKRLMSVAGFGHGHEEPHAR